MRLCHAPSAYSYDSSSASHESLGINNFVNLIRMFSFTSYHAPRRHSPSKVKKQNDDLHQFQRHHPIRDQSNLFTSQKTSFWYFSSFAMKDQFPSFSPHSSCKCHTHAKFAPTRLTISTQLPTIICNSVSAIISLFFLFNWILLLLVSRCIAFSSHDNRVYCFCCYTTPQSLFAPAAALLLANASPFNNIRIMYVQVDSEV